MRVAKSLLAAVSLIAMAARAEDAPVVTVEAPDAVEVDKIEAAEAANLAYDLKVEASVVQLDVQSEAGQTMQGYIDQMAAVATILDAEIRAGADKGDTRGLYRELRRIRLDALELAKSGKVTLPPGAAETFEKLMSDLGRYHSDTSAVSQEPQPVTE